MASLIELDLEIADECYNVIPNFNCHFYIYKMRRSILYHNNVTKMILFPSARSLSNFGKLILI